MSEPVRGTERRQANHGPQEGGDRRQTLADRRGENNLQFSSFRIGGTDFILDIRHVQEVLLAQEMTQVPLASRLLAGLINLRGEIVPVVHLHSALQVPPADPSTAMNVVVYAEAGAFSLIVDEVHDILDISPTMILPPPPNLPGHLRGLTSGVCKLPDRLLLILDVPGIVSLVETRAA